MSSFVSSGLNFFKQTDILIDTALWTYLKYLTSNLFRVLYEITIQSHLTL